MASESIPGLNLEPIICVVDDDVSVRESLEMLIRHAGWKVEIYASAHAFLARVRVDAPSCVILDVTLPDLNGLDIQQRVSIDQARAPIIFITGHHDVPISVQAMKAGAFEFLTKPFVDEVLLTAIRSAIEHSQKALIEETKLLKLRDRYLALTPREQEVMKLVVAGLLNKQVASDLGISVITVKAHRGKLMRKMSVESLADLVRMAERLKPPSTN